MQSLRSLSGPTNALSRALFSAAALLLALGVALALVPWLGEGAQAFFVAVPLVAAVSAWCGVRWALAMVLALVAWLWLPALPPDWPAHGWAAPPSPGWVAAVLVLVGAAFAGRLTPGARMQPSAAAFESPLMQRTRRALWLSTALALMLPLVLLHTYTVTVSDGAEHAAALAAESAADIAGEHVIRIVHAKQIILRQINAELRDADPATPEMTAQRLHRLLSTLAQQQPQLQSLWVMDAAGYPVGNSIWPQAPRINYADREYFKHHLAHAGSIYVSQVLVSRATGELFFDVSVRRDDPQGGFAGVVNVSFRPQYFSEFFRGILASRPSMQIMLLRTDGAVLARSDTDVRPGERLPDGHRVLALMQQPPTPAAATTATGSLRDADARQDIVWRHLATYPLYVAVFADAAAIRRAWMRDAAALGATALLASSLLLMALWTVWRRTLAEMHALNRLAAESEQRLQAERRLQHAQKLEAMGQLTSSVVHDFNNLLGVVKNNIVVIQHAHPDLGSSAPLAGMQRAVRSGERLTRKLLAFSRRQTLQPERIDLARWLPAVRDLLDMTLGSAVSLQIDVEPDTPPIEVDAAELELGLLNLAANARDAIAATGTVRIQAGPLPPSALPAELAANPEASYVLISFIDDGQGMEARIRERAFEPFFTTKGEGKGTGLGLRQVHNLCSQAGGAALLDSAPGAGTTVRMYFPASVHAPEAVRPHPGEQPLPAAHILLVDDNRELAQATAALLQTMGARVSVAYSAREAQRCLQQPGAAIDLVLSDMILGGGDGDELADGLALARAVRASTPQLPVVLFTGFTTQREQATAAGFTVLSKPVDPATLVSTIAGALAHRG